MITSPIEPAYVRGVAELEPTERGTRLHRLPAWVRDQFPDGQLMAMESQPSGVRLVFRTRVDGLEHLPSSGATIVAFNHISALDGPVLAIEIGRRIKRESRFLVAAEFFRKGFFGWILRRYDQIPIRRGEADGPALEAALTAVKEGVLLAVAPEGTVNPDPDTLMRIRSGVARIALPSGAPVVPVGIWGTHRRWPSAGPFWGRPWRPRLVIVFGEPLLGMGLLGVGALAAALVYWDLNRRGWKTVLE